MRDCRGFTYIGLMVAIAIIGITTAVIGQTWKTAARLEKEKQLLWVGNQYRQAIGRYYEAKEIPPHPPGIFPSELQGLLKDPRSFGLHRYIRKLYKDPITGKDDWVPVFDDKMHIKGVHSKSDMEPMKKDNFYRDDENFRGKTRYSEWIFEYIPGVTGVSTGAVISSTGATTGAGGTTTGGTTGTSGTGGTTGTGGNSGTGTQGGGTGGF